MKHYELLFLLHQAYLLRKLIEAAERAGEVFHVVNNFSTLENKVEAMAIIQRINPTDKEPVLILRLKGTELIAETAFAFFNGPFVTVPGSLPGNEYVFYSTDVPKLVTVPTDAPTDSSNDAATPSATNNS